MTTKTFEEVAYLAWHGVLPDGKDIAQQNSLERSSRALPGNVSAAILDLPLHSHPLDVCRVAVSLLGATGQQAASESVESDLAAAVRIFAALPSIVAIDQRRRAGLLPVEPRLGLDYVANLIWMISGREPGPSAIRDAGVAIAFHVEQSLTPSLVVSQVIGATGSDVYSAVVGAMGAFKGLMHGSPLDGLDGGQFSKYVTSLDSVTSSGPELSIMTPVHIIGQIVGWTARCVDAREVARRVSS